MLAATGQRRPAYYLALRFREGTMLSKIVGLAKKVRRSAAFKHGIAAPKRLAVAMQQRTNKGIYSVEIEATMGFFAVLQSILFILVYCENNKLYPDISARGGLYGEKTGTVDWFGQLFHAAQNPDRKIVDRLASRRDVRTSRIRGVEDLGFRARYEKALSLSEASTLFNKYYRPAPDVIADVDELGKRLEISASTIAVHYRGTDKIHEAGKVPWQKLCDAVDEISGNDHGMTNIVLASDDAQFIEFFRTRAFRIPAKVVPAVYMPKGDTPVHFSGHPGLAIGREALVTCLLLARCGFLIKTPSYLSAWAKIFNPSLPVFLISPPLGNGRFPDRVLWLDQQSGKAFAAELKGQRTEQVTSDLPYSASPK
jgi:hypothetical protein